MKVQFVHAVVGVVVALAVNAAVLQDYICKPYQDMWGFPCVLTELEDGSEDCVTQADDNHYCERIVYGGSGKHCFPQTGSQCNRIVDPPEIPFTIYGGTCVVKVGYYVPDGCSCENQSVVVSGFTAADCN